MDRPRLAAGVKACAHGGEQSVAQMTRAVLEPCDDCRRHAVVGQFLQRGVYDDPQHYLHPSFQRIPKLPVDSRNPLWQNGYIGHLPRIVSHQTPHGFCSNFSQRFRVEQIGLFGNGLISGGPDDQIAGVCSFELRPASRVDWLAGLCQRMSQAA